MLAAGNYAVKGFAMANAPMTRRLDNAIIELAGLSGWKPEKAADHVATIAEAMVEKANERARTAALKMFVHKPVKKARGRRQSAAASA